MSTGSTFRGYRRAAVSDTVKQLFKEVIWATLYRHRPDPAKPPIAVFSSRRGGSTLMMEVLAENPGITFSDQPFSLYTATRTQINRLPVFGYSQIIAHDALEFDQISAYTAAILSGEITVNGPWKFWRSGRLRSDRMVLKITDAKTIAEELVQQFGLIPVVMTRHPISQGLSVEKNGWDASARAFLRSETYVKTFLSPDRLTDAREIMNEGDPMQIRMLDWTLENLPLMAALDRNDDWTYLAYEDLVADPEASVARLADACNLPNRDGMLQQLSKPSRSTKKSSTAETRSQIAAGDLTYMLSRWRSGVTPEQEQQWLAIPERFGLPLYRIGSDRPVWPLRADGKVSDA